MATMELLCDGQIRCKMVSNRFIRNGFVASAKVCKLRHLRIYSEADGRWLHLEMSKVASSTESKSGKTIIFNKVDLIRRNSRVLYGAGMVIGATTVNLVGKSQTDIEDWLDRIRDVVSPIPFEERVRGKAFVVSVIDERQSLRTKLTGRLVVRTSVHDVAFFEASTGLSLLIVEWQNVIKVETVPTKQDEDVGRVFKIQMIRSNEKKPLALTVYCKDGQRFIAEFQRRKAVALVKKTQFLSRDQNGTMPITKSAQSERFFRRMSSSRSDSNKRPSVHYPKTRSGPLGSFKSWLRRSLPSLLVDDIPPSQLTPDSTTSTIASDDEEDEESSSAVQWDDGVTPQLRANFDSTTRVDYDQLFPGLSARDSLYSPHFKAAHRTSSGSNSTLPSHYHRLPIRERTMTARSEGAADHRVQYEPSYINLQQLERSLNANGKPQHYASLGSILPQNSLLARQLLLK